MKKVFIASAIISLMGFCTQKSKAQALNFGAYSYIDLNDNILPDNQSYTKECWVKMYSTNAVHGRNFISAYDHPFWVENGYLSAANSYGSSFTATLVDPVAFPLSVWTHVAVTYDAATTTMKLYRNGNLVASTTTAPAYFGSPLMIGSVDGGDFLDGTDVDEVRIWDVARTQSEIQAAMNCDVPAQSHLIAYYRFDQGTPNGNNTSLLMAYDYSGNGNCGELVNFDLSSGKPANYINGYISSCYSIVPSLSAPAAITGTAVVCEGSSVALSDATSGGEWSSGDINIAAIAADGTVTGVNNGTVAISYTTCGGIAIKTVTVNDKPSVTAVVSNGSINTTVTGGIAPYTYSWSNGSTNADLNGLSSGAYTVNVTDVKGCSVSVVYSVSTTVSLSSSISITPENKIFTGGYVHNYYFGYGPQKAVLTMNPTGASSFTYSWAPSTYLSSTDTRNPTFQPSAAGIYTYTCTAAYAGFTTSSTVTLCVVDAVDHSHTDKVVICHKDKHGNHPHTKTIKTKDVAKKLTKDKYDHLGACYAGCGTGAKLSPSVQGQIIFADEAEVTAYPNPFNTELHVFIQAAKPEPISITVYDLSGRVVENVTDAETNTEITLGSSLASGMYLLQVKDGNTKKMLKIVKN